MRRRLGVLAMAVAVPAVAAPSVREAVPDTAAFAPQAQYDAPLDPEFAAFSPSADAPSISLAASDAMPAELTLAAAVDVADKGPAARAFAMGGTFTDRQRAEECLAMAVYYEAASESTDGQRAVAQVVMNRVRHPSYPNTVCGVVFQGSQRTTGCQFSFTCDGSLARQPSVAGWTKARRVASAALGGFVFAPVGLATHYHRTDILPYWASSLTTVGTIGLHRFYRWRGAASAASAFSAVYAGGEPLPVRNTGSAVTPLAGDLGVPLVPAVVQVVASIPAQDAAAAAPVARAAAAAPVAPAYQSELFPASGDVREEYAASGRWIAQP